MRIAVTGAHGFVGRALCDRLYADGHHVVPIVRRATGMPAERVCGDIGDAAAVAGVLHDIDVVVHCAARVHVMDETAADPLVAFRQVNVAGTSNLAREARRAGARRFVLLSSIKVNGETTDRRAAFTAHDAPAPEDAYGQSKLEAERALIEIADDRLETVIVRPPLVYGPGVKGNMRTMIDWIARRRSLPLARATANRRSLVSLYNLCDFLACVAIHPRAAGGTFLVSDDDDVSTARLLREIGVAVDRPARLTPVPLVLLRGALILAGKRTIADRLLGSLVVDIAASRTTLGWAPPQSLQQGLRLAAGRLINESHRE